MPPASTATPVGVPLSTSTAMEGSSWAVVAMGHLDDPDNTFWQLLTRPVGSTQWQLFTPPGVASNGGLVASFTPPETVTAGFEPTQDLEFSPLAQTTASPAARPGGQAATWATGVLPAGMAAAPDALAASGDHRYLALLRSGGGTVVASSGDLSTWSTVTSIRSLARDPATSACGITALTAVALSGDGAAVGTRCAHGTRPGIFESVHGSWRAVGPELPDGSGPVQVLRLVATPAGVSALVASGPAGSDTLYALFGADGLRTWAVSTPLHPGRAPLASTGVTAAGGLVVTTAGAGNRRSAWVVGPSGGRWLPLAAPPPGTSTVVAGPGTTFEALIADQSTLHVDVLGTGGWRRVQSLAVAIQYGSSS